jgi:hypothetical protein
MIRFYDEGAVNITQIPGLLQEWRAPRHPEFAKSGKTAWRLFNAATECLKGDLWRLSDRTRAIHQILDVEFRKEESVVVPLHSMSTDVRN